MKYSPAPAKVSLVMTVFNEADNIEQVLQSLCRQTRRPDEVVIVDGGSQDGTVAMLEAFAAQSTELLVRCLSRPGYNISQGRNAAIEAASFELIAVTDAGTRLPPNWLAELVVPFFAASTQPVEVVAGFFQADSDPHSAFQIAMGATVLPVQADIRPEKFLPSSRSIAFTKAAWLVAGGYPEWLDYCEDLIFDLNLKRQGYTFYWQPTACVLFAPRRRLSDFFRQYYRYARGDGKADLFLKRHLLRYLTYLVFAPLMAGLAQRYRWLWWPFVAAGLAYLRTPYRRIFSQFGTLSLPQKAVSLAYVPLIRLTGDVAKMLGYPVGVWWRLFHKV